MIAWPTRMTFVLCRANPHSSGTGRHNFHNNQQCTFSQQSPTRSARFQSYTPVSVWWGTHSQYSDMDCRRQYHNHGGCQDCCQHVYLGGDRLSENWHLPVSCEQSVWHCLWGCDPVWHRWVSRMDSREGVLTLPFLKCASLTQFPPPPHTHTHTHTRHRQSTRSCSIPC